MSILNFKITRSSGFTLIELLVVVAIIGILSAIGTLTYSGYVKAAKRSSAENIMQQVSLAQTEEYSLTGEYWRSGAQDTTTCSANDKDASIALEAALFSGKEVITKSDSGFNMCIFGSASDYTIKAENADGCVLQLPRNDIVDAGNDKC